MWHRNCVKKALSDLVTFLCQAPVQAQFKRARSWLCFLPVKRRKSTPMHATHPLLHGNICNLSRPHKCKIFTVVIKNPCNIFTAINAIYPDNICNLSMVIYAIYPGIISTIIYTAYPSWQHMQHIHGNLRNNIMATYATYLQ